MNKRDLLFEIGVEEIPARFLPPAIKQLRQLAEGALQENLLPYDSLEVWATPRRLVLSVSGLAEMQPDSQSESKGPSLKVAYDAEGKPTKALLGFCKGQGVNEADLVQKQIGNNTYLFANKCRQGAPALTVLPPLLTELVHKIYFPKPMRWGYEEMRFARPIHWLLALFGSEVVPLEIAGQQTGKISRGHRVFGSDHIEINEPSEYLAKLADNYVIVEQDKRRELIWQGVQQVAQAAGGQVKDDPELLEEIVYLVEYPTALMGKFEDKYLEIPAELVITPMREHQRYFPVYGLDGKLLARFITVRNGDANHLEIVAAGNEKVLKARLADAEFFWQEDINKPLSDNCDRLDTIVFHEKLGTLAEKMQRVAALGSYLAQQLGADTAKVQRTAYLMKGDLLSNVVYEFPELQGIMGEYYAQHAGEDAEVAQAIREHYQPRFAGDELPQTMTGKIAAIADKLDSVVGFFAIDMQPTGSQDPYALRRAANGIAQIIVDAPLTLAVGDLVAESYRLIAAAHPLVKPEAEVVEAVRAFLGNRLENLLNEQGIRYDVVNAVAAVGYDDLADARQRAAVLQKYRSEAAFAELLAGFTRAANLLKNAASKKIMPAELTVKETLLTDASEQALYAKLASVQEVVAQAVAARDYEAALTALASLRQPIDAFFTDVMVMAEDTAVRDNRLALLAQIVALTAGIGDLAQIVE